MVLSMYSHTAVVQLWHSQQLRYLPRVLFSRVPTTVVVLVAHGDHEIVYGRVRQGQTMKREKDTTLATISE